MLENFVFSAMGIELHCAQENESKVKCTFFHRPAWSEELLGKVASIPLQALRKVFEASARTLGGSGLASKIS